MPPLKKYTIIRDTREKNGWNFDFYESCEAIIDQGLKTGDYTAVGLEEDLIIERKATTAELALNLGKKRKQFEAELERMQEFRWAYIVCEFSEDNVREFPINSTVPASKRKYLRMNGKFMLKCLYDYKEKYGVEIIFTNTKEEAEEKAIEIIKQAYEK
jgi:hypothetical protein